MPLLRKKTKARFWAAIRLTYLKTAYVTIFLQSCQQNTNASLLNPLKKSNQRSWSKSCAPSCSATRPIHRWWGPILFCNFKLFGQANPVLTKLELFFKFKDALSMFHKKVYIKIFRITWVFWFRSSHFSFFVFWSLSWSSENTKILHNLCLHFAKQDGQNGKKGKKVTKLKWPKYQKPKDKHIEWTKH